MISIIYKNPEEEIPNINESDLHNYLIMFEVIIDTESWYAIVTKDNVIGGINYEPDDVYRRGKYAPFTWHRMPLPASFLQILISLWKAYERHGLSFYIIHTDKELSTFIGEKKITHYELIVNMSSNLHEKLNRKIKLDVTS